jgi:oligopeptide transport system ATP-binding protein
VSMAEELLRVDHLFKTFDRPGLFRGQPNFAVDDVSFSVRRGETFGLVGESGSGKSTTARLILGLERATSGHIWFLGRDQTHLSRRQLRRTRRDVQIVFQDPIASLNRRKTVEQIIRFPLTVHQPASRQAHDRLVVAAMDLVGLAASLRQRYPHELSGGQGQRVGIARAIVLNPQLVVLDEAVSSLDVSVRAQILNLLRDLQQRLHLTYVFISHDLAVVRYMSDHVGVMFRGRLVEHGSREALFSNPLHPYTEELLARGTVQVSNGPGEGAPTTALQGDEDSECRYRTRCYLGRDVEVCRKVDPSLVKVGVGHLVACHLRAPQSRKESIATIA